MEALSLGGTACAEVPGLVLFQLLVINGLLAGLHYAVFVKIVVGGVPVFVGYGLLAGLHFTVLIERVALGADGENLRTVFSEIGLAVFEVEGIFLIRIAEPGSAFDCEPAGSAAAAVLFVIVAEIV